MKIDAVLISKWIIRTVISLIVLTGIIIVLSNIYAPFTTQSQVQMPTINIHPEVSGNVTAVYVENGQSIQQGDAIYSIDNKEYLINVRDAKAKLIAAQTNLESMKAQLNIDKSALAQQKAIYRQALKHFHRYNDLFATKQISEEEFDQAQSDKESNYFLVKQKEAEISQTKSLIGLPNQNPDILQAKSTLATAELNLERTTVYAGGSGIISNLQIDLGDYVSASTNTMVIVDDQQQYLAANFNEKGLNTLTKGSSVAIIFDAYPGKIFPGTVLSSDKAIQSGVSQTGKLSTMDASDRWIRKSEQFPIRIELQSPPNALIAGSKATVMAAENTHPFWHAFSGFVMTTMSYLRYVY
ncbi:HlyD family secretion protein [Vibrio sp. SS-MA-C1-2]|uniref:HlyD family secretion protein n=1 Tax=Vibrio sp. SS-MA-C1-2 TaxID=2908646 RepID=UPI001F2136BB|nr:HlyD family secretion protein [Vibrio sp. SS-MA-C1-2]UJF17992.1 HlyD family secretion protein [Vibrio sp. SS-MA-C1-2]